MQFEARIESTGDAPQKARDLLRGKLADRVPATTLADVLTVVSELVTNAVTHGGGSEARLAVEVLSASVAGTVENDGHGIVQYEEPDPQALRGLGLHVVNAVATTWSIEHDHGPVTRVAFEIDFS